MAWARGLRGRSSVGHLNSASGVHWALYIHDDLGNVQDNALTTRYTQAMNSSIAYIKEPDILGTSRCIQRPIVVALVPLILVIYSTSSISACGFGVRISSHHSLVLLLRTVHRSIHPSLSFKRKLEVSTPPNPQHPPPQQPSPFPSPSQTLRQEEQERDWSKAEKPMNSTAGILRRSVSRHRHRHPLLRQTRHLRHRWTL